MALRQRDRERLRDHRAGAAQWHAVVPQQDTRPADLADRGLCAFDEWADAASGASFRVGGEEEKAGGAVHAPAGAEGYAAMRRAAWVAFVVVLGGCQGVQ